MAQNYIGELISQERVRRGWRFGDLARACGALSPRQISRVAQRLVLFEREGVRDQGLLRKVVLALELDPVRVNELLDRQHREGLAEWNAWVDEPAPIQLHVRPFAGFWYRHALPPDAAADESRAIDYARRLTIGRRDFRVVLALNRRVALTFAEGELIARSEATPDRSVSPVMTVGGRPVMFEEKDGEPSR